MKRGWDLFNILRQEALVINLTDVDRKWTEDVVIILEDEWRSRVKQAYRSIKTVSCVTYYFGVILQTLKPSLIYANDVWTKFCSTQLCLKCVSLINIQLLIWKHCHFSLLFSTHDLIQDDQNALWLHCMLTFVNDQTSQPYLIGENLITKPWALICCCKSIHSYEKLSTRGEESLQAAGLFSHLTTNISVTDVGW